MNQKIKLKLCVSDIVVTIIILVSVLAMIIYFYFNNKPTADARVYITIAGREVGDYPLNEDLLIKFFPNKEKNTIDKYHSDQFMISYDLNSNLILAEINILIENLYVGVTKETSPKNICSNMGKISTTNSPIICDPNHLKILIRGSFGIDIHV